MEKSAEVQQRLAEALNIFRQQHGNESSWTPEDIRWHDLLVNRIMSVPDPT